MRYSTDGQKDISRLKDSALVLFFTTGVSLKTWYDVGMIAREVALYNVLSSYFKQIFFFTYGTEEDFAFSKYLADNIIIVPKKYVSSDLIYSLLMPFIHRGILADAEILKTNQMWGSWSAVLAKYIHRKKLIVRTGFTLSLRAAYTRPSIRHKLWDYVVRLIERLAYRAGDGIITTSKRGFEYVQRLYHPRGVQILIPNYVETDKFRPLHEPKKRGSICFVGRLTKQKNLFALLSAVKNSSHTLTIIGSGEEGSSLKDFAAQNNIHVDFIGNIANADLPRILNQHEIFVLPSLWEGMPKILLEAMACGMPVIGTNVDGIREVIQHGVNGYLCSPTSASIRSAINTVLGNAELEGQLGDNARKTIIQEYDLTRLVEKELHFMAELL